MWALLAIFHEFRVDDLSRCEFRLVKCSTSSFQAEMEEGVVQNTLPGMKTHHKEILWQQWHDTSELLARV